MDKCQLKVGKDINEFFESQSSQIKCIMIGLELNKNNVHAIHITKNAYIKLHVDKRDMDYSIIGWLAKGAPSGGYFKCTNYGIELQLAMIINRLLEQIHCSWKRGI
jgi:hypothetical protein